VRCYGEHVGEHIGNLLGTETEHVGNTLGTRKKMKKNPSHPKLERKQKARYLECMLGASHWLHEISLPKKVSHHFWLGVIPFPKNTLPS